jgi:O-antigen ligase
MSKHDSSRQGSFNDQFSLWIVGGLLAVLPIIYLPGYFTYSTWKYLVFGTMSLVLGVLTLRLWLLNSKLPKQIFGHYSRYALLLYLGVFILVTLFSVNPAFSVWSSFQGLDGLLTYIFLVIFSLVVATVVAVGGRPAALQIMKASVIGATLLSVLVFLSADGLGQWFEGSRGGATVGNSSLAAAYLVWNIFLGLIAIYNAKGWRQRTAWITCLALIVFSPVFVGWQAIIGRVEAGGLMSYVGAARAAAVSVALAAIISLAIWLWSKGSKLRFVAVALGVVIVLGLGFVVVGFLQPTSIVKTKFVQTGGEQRLIFWDISTGAIKENPILGWGPSTFDIVFHKKFDPRTLFLPEQGETLVKNPHNLILEILSNGGVVLLLATLLLWLSLIYSLYQAKQNGNLSLIEFAILVGAFSAWFVQAQLIYDPLVATVMFFSLLGISYGLASGSESSPGQKRYALSPMRRNIVIGSGVAALLLFWVAVFLPYKEANTLKALKVTALPERLKHFENLGKNSPIVRGYDSVRLANIMYEEYYSQKTAIAKGDPKKRELAAEELAAMSKYMFNLANQENSHPEIAFLAARLSFIEMELEQGKKQDTVQRAIELGDLAVKHTPTDPRAYWIAAQIKFAARNYDQAKQLLEQSIALEPKLEGPYDLLLAMAARQNDRDYYERILNKAQQEIPGYENKSTLPE